MNRRILLVVIATLNVTSFAFALPPRDPAKAARSSARQATQRQQVNLGSSPSLSSRSSAANRSAVNRNRVNSGASLVQSNNRVPMNLPRNRPGNRPIIDLRPTYPSGNSIQRSGIGSSVIGNNNRVNNTIINNNNTIINNNYGNQQINRNRPRNRGGSYYNNLHYGWNPTGWNSYRPVYGNYYGYSTNSSVVSVGGLTVGATTVGFANPFYVRPTTVVAGLDYSQPIHVPAPDYRETNDDLVNSEQAVRHFDEARERFRRGEYANAGALVDEAIRLLPNDPTLHQFRALVLFARGKYQDAAAAAYSVLAVDSGWTRDTLSKLYDDPKQYEAQFRALQRFVETNPRAIDAQFLLGYHYLMLGEFERALQNLEVVRAARPDDRVTANLISAIRNA